MLGVSREFIFASTRRRVSLFLLLAFVAMYAQATSLMSMDVKVGEHRVGITQNIYSCNEEKNKYNQLEIIKLVCRPGA